MGTNALRLLIRQKLADGRLPRNGVPKVWGVPGSGEQCHACDELVAKSDFLMEGPVLSGGRAARHVQLHVLCFHVWDDERRRLPAGQVPSTSPAAMSEATAYRNHLILTIATKQSVGWAVAITIYDADGVLAMESVDFGGGVMFDTQDIADQAGVLFERAWIDRRRVDG